ncbi:DNA polymerase III subunit gamma and tau [Promicromonospora citrea]|uniref:DNA polymerase III subunit gamma and tau n=2 Tax=Promicromonospora citrea TaxID=43677 RepID=UPI00166DC344|nr:DNA polymerase III subunit gamma and tau [Promicromonospora citrea]
MSTALYRRYRPETFAEVIGQDHVTGPLMQALRSGRVNHAYLFSGPRGCGKTTSARILARTLNCARNTPETPIDTPCGECASCVELARGGPGSLDVVEIDAASHNGVDDARDLRERATFAPARDRYKIFILDEAHMVTPQGFNALLKIVEEPPPHIKFIFATTEPDKVIGTIRSRTHHYPFRLVPPDVLSPYLEQLCAAEGIEVGGGVLPLVTRAGGGSVRDSLSVMDQLIAGASDGAVEYDLAVGLLGFTHSSLLDDVVDALAARDGGSIFRVVDQVIATGHEPRRFVEDVLERLRDLIVIAVSGDAAAAVLRGIPADQLERMRAQASRLGVAELSRAADLVNAALTEMTGATSPRLHLELLCARLLLPGADDGAAGLAARIDRLERRGIGAGGAPAPSASGGVTAAEPAPGGGLTGAAAARAVLDARKKRTEPEGSAAGPRQDGGAGPAVPDAAAVGGDPGGDAAPEPAAPEPAAPEPAAPEPAPPSAAAAPSRASDASSAEDDTRAGGSAGDAAEAGAAPGDGIEPGVTTETVRRRWPEVLGALAVARVTWSLVGPNAQVVALESGTLKLGFAAPGLARAFSNARHTSAVEEAVYQTLGVRVRVEATLDDGTSGGGASGGPPPGGGASGGGTPAGTPGAGGGGAGSPRPAGGGTPTAPAATATATDWPEVTPPGGGAVASATSTGSGLATAVPAGSVAVAERPAPAGAAGPEAAPAEEAQGSLAAGVQGTTHPEPARPEPSRPEPSRPEPSGPDAARRDTGRTNRPGAARPDAATSAQRPGPAASSVDEAWLAGASVSEPPADYDMPEPEPVYEDQAPVAARPPVSGAVSAREALRQANERRARAANAGPAATRPGPSGSPATGSPATDDPDFYDEPSDDDPDITSTGLVGVPLVVQVLGGTVIDEIVEQS